MLTSRYVAAKASAGHRECEDDANDDARALLMSDLPNQKRTKNRNDVRARLLDCAFAFVYVAYP